MRHFVKFFRIYVIKIHFFIRQIFFSDEAILCLNVTVYGLNCRCRCKENLHWITDPFTQHPEKVNVWGDIVQDGPLTEQIYIDFY